MAVLELRNGIVTYRNKENVLSVGVSDSLREILSIKEFDMGYVVFDARYSHSSTIIEEYLDLEYGLSVLGLSALKNKYFKGVRRETICVKNI